MIKVSLFTILIYRKGLFVKIKHKKDKAL